ncbi:hypothetical protein D9613_008503 [Agrocybe pediades]|uniref:Prolyl 4-hydroxylase alpha subunit Fe(2+) 2OG dioxygenase domain-containing protein n=1 Tax=Agrocybe pediades TaxID=84607 RepID=A0A8H4QUB2_9AGAR|nr:hypothetical protein D9613_008503 [Agrocybe pediades]
MITRAKARLIKNENEERMNMDMDGGAGTESQVEKPKFKADSTTEDNGTPGDQHAQNEGYEDEEAKHEEVEVEVEEVEDEEVEDEESEDESEESEDQLSEGEDLQGDLEDVLEGDDLDFAGEFFHAALQTTAPNPCLHIADIGFVGLPLSQRDAQAVISAATLAPFGRGERTLVDKEVRDTWEIEPSKISFANPEWEKYINQTVCLEVCRALGVTIGNIPPKMELYKLLLYEKGSHFLPHQDTQKANGMFATVIILLSSAYTGGQVVVSHASTTKTIDFSANSLLSTALLAWYTDVKHEVKPVTSGYRFALSYNLIHQSPAGIPRLKDTSDAASRLKRVLGKWRENKYSNWDGGLMAYLLQHQYSSANLKDGIKSLKGVDLYRATFLRPIAEALGFIVGLASLTHNISGQAEDMGGYHGSRRWGRRRYDYSDESELDTDEGYSDRNYRIPEIIEMNDPSTEISCIMDLDGKPLVANGKMNLKDECLIPKDPFKGVAPDHREYEGYQGNYGGQVDQWYRRTVLVLIHRNNLDDLCYSIEGVTYALRKVQESSDPPSSKDRYWANKVVHTPTQLSSNKALTMMDYALKWKDEVLWRKVMSCPMCTLKNVDTKLLLDAWALFSFEDVRVSFEEIVARATNLSDKMSFLSTVREATSAQERPSVLPWYKKESEKILSSPSLSNVQDPSTVLALIEFGGLEAFKRITMPNILKFGQYKVLLSLLKTFQERSDIITAQEIRFNDTEHPATTTSSGTPNSTIAQTPAKTLASSISTSIDQMSKECLKAAALRWSAGSLAIPNRFLDARPVLNSTVERIITILDNAIALSQMDVCRNLLIDIFNSNGSASDKFSQIYIPLIPRLKQLLAKKNIDMCTSPYIDFLQLLIGLNLQDILGTKGQLPSMNLRKIGCGCFECGTLDNFILYDPAATKVFRVVYAQRIHLERQCGFARDICSYITIKSGHPHAIQVTKVPQVVPMSSWLGRQKNAATFLKTIGDGAMIAKIMGSRARDVRDAISGTTPYKMDTSHAFSKPAQVAPAKNKAVQQRVLAQPVPPSSAVPKRPPVQAGTTSKSLPGPTATSGMQASSSNSKTTVTSAVPAQVAGTKRKTAPTKYVQLGPVIDLSSDDA